MNIAPPDLLLSLWRASWQGAIALTLIWIVCRALARRLPADAHCWLWRLGYVKLLVGLLWSGVILLPVLTPAPSLPPQPQNTSIAIPMSAPASSAANIANVVPPGSLDAPRSDPWRNWQTLLAAVYAVGIAICLIRLCIAARRTHRALQLAIPINAGPETDCAAELAHHLGLRRVPMLARSAIVDSPVFLAGRILLPAGADYAEADLRMILAHELAHARRRDLAWEWLGITAQIAFFFHPLVVVARREERLAREAAADSLALRATDADAAAYGRMLLTLALKPSRPHPSLAGAVGVIEGGSSLRRRLLALRDGAKFRCGWRTAVALALLMGLVLTPWQVTHGQAAAPLGVPIGIVSATLPKMPAGDKSIKGVVHDEKGKAVAGLDISLIWHWSLNQADGMPITGESSVGNVITDAQGLFRFSSLPAGKFDYQILSPTDQYAALRGSVVINNADSTKALSITVSTGVLIDGRVVDGKTHQPIAGICVGAADVTPDKTKMTGTRTPFTRTDAQGRYKVRVMPGFVAISIGTIKSPSLNPRTGRTMRFAQVPSRTSFKMSDTPVYLDPAIICVAQDGKPIAGARYYVTRLQGGKKEFGSFGLTQPTGVVVLSGDNGLFSIRQGARTVSGTFHCSPGSPLTLTVGSKTTSYPSNLANVVLPEAPSAEITGHIVSPQGKPIPNALVRIDESDPKTQYGIGQRTVKADSSGVFHATLYLNQQNYVCIRADKFNQVNISNRLPALSAGTATDLGAIRLLHANGYIAGRLVDTSGKPMKGVLAAARGGKTLVSAALTDTQGRFHIPNIVSGETLRLKFCLRGVVPDSGDPGEMSNQQMEISGVRASTKEMEIVWRPEKVGD